MLEETDRLTSTVDALLALSRAEAGLVTGTRESFSLNELITKCLNLLVNQALFQDIEVNMDLESGLPGMVGDVGQLQQVFTNLFINAADAMGGKGRLDISSRYDRQERQFIVKVADTGPGIPEEFQNKIFDIFFTTKPVGKGTGLGLAISQNIINFHGGSLRFECPPQGGTVFIIEFPFEFDGPSGEESVFVDLDE